MLEFIGQFSDTKNSINVKSFLLIAFIYKMCDQLKPFPRKNFKVSIEEYSIILLFGQPWLRKKFIISMFPDSIAEEKTLLFHGHFLRYRKFIIERLLFLIAIIYNG